MRLTIWALVGPAFVLLVSIRSGSAQAGELGPLGKLAITVEFKGVLGIVPPDGPVTLQLACTNPIAFSSRFHTNAGGHVEIEAPPGDCVVSTLSSVPFRHKWYGWRGSVTLSPARPIELTLSSKNALVPEGEDSPSRMEPSVPSSQIAREGAEPILPDHDRAWPEPYFIVHADYPERAHKTAWEGDVNLRGIIDLQGNARELEITDSANPMFDDAAIAAALQWKWLPARGNGQAVEVYYPIKVRFRLRRWR